MSNVGSGGEAFYDIVVNTAGLDQVEAAVNEATKGAADKGRRNIKALDDEMAETAKRMGRNAQKMGVAINAGLSAGLKGGPGGGGKGPLSTLEHDIIALQKTMKARAQQFAKSGLSPNLLSTFTEEERQLQSLKRRVARDTAKLAADPDARRALELEFQARRKLITQEGAQLLQLQKENTSRLNREAREQQRVARELAQTVAATVRQTDKLALTDRRNTGSLARVEGQGAQQRLLNQEKQDGQKRIANQRFVLDSIARLEKGFGATVKGVASTTTGAISKLYGGTVGSLRRNMSERHQIISGGLRNETILFQKAQAVQQRAQQGFLGIGLRQAAFVGGGLGLVGAITSTFTKGADFTQGLRVLGAQLELTEEQMAAVRQTALDLGNDITLPGVSALDAAQGIQLLSKQFAALGPAAIGAAQAASKGALQLQIATKATAEEAAGLVGSAVNVFGIGAENATAVADQISQALAKSAGISITDFSQGFTQAATVFSQFVTPAEGATESLVDFNTALAVLAKGGLVGSDAGTSLRSFFIQANRGTADADNAMKLLTTRAGETGSAFFDLAGQARPFEQTLDILRKGIEGYTDEQKASTLQTIFGTDAIRAANILLGTNSFAYRDLKNQIADSTGAAKRFADAQSGGLRRALDAVSSSFETLQIRAFEFADKALGPAALSVANFVGNLISGEGAFEVVRRGLLGVAAGLAAVVAAKLGVEILGLLAKTLPLLLTPFGALSVVAAGLGAAFVIASKNSGSFGKTLEKIRDIAGEVGTFLRTQVGRGLEELGERLAPIADRLLPGFSRLAGIFRSFRDAVGESGLGAGIKVLRTNLTLLGRDVVASIEERFPIARKAVILLGDGIERVGDVIRKFKSDGLGAGFADLGKAILGGLAGIGRGLAAAIQTSIGRAGIGAGVGATIGGIIAGPLGVALGGAIGAAVGLAIPKIREALGRIDVPALFGQFLKGVELVGRKIGEILSDKRFLLAVAGIAAGAAAVGVKFVQGFVSGVLSNLGDIAEVGQTILSQIFNLPSIVKSVAAFALLIRGALIGQFKQAQIGKTVGQLFAGDFVTTATKGIKQQSLGQKLSTIFTEIGKGAGQALTIGLAAALSGSALGSATSGLEKGLGIAGIAGSAAASFAALGGGPQGAAAAAGAVGIGVLTAAFSANAKKAAEAKAAIEEYKDAVLAAGGDSEAAADAIEGRFNAALDDLSTEGITGIKLLNVNMAAFREEIANGGGAEALERIRKRMVELGGGGPIVSAISKDAAAATVAFDFLEKQVVAVDAAVERADLRKSLDVKGILPDVVGLARGLLDAAAAKRKLLQQERNENAKQAIAEIKARTDELGLAADQTREKIRKMLAGETDQRTPEQSRNEAVQSLPSVASSVSEAVSTGLDTVLGGAQLATSLEGFKQQLATATSDGAGNIFDPTTVAQNLDVLRLGIAQNVTDANVAGILNQALTDFQNTVLPVAIPLDAQADLQKAAAAGDVAAAEALAAAGRAGPISIQAAADFNAATAAGASSFVTADTAARLAGSIKPRVEADEPAAAGAGKTMGEAARTAAAGVSFSSVGAAMADGMKGGILGGITRVAEAARSLVASAKRAAESEAGIASPSKVFMGIGEDITAGLVEGLRDGSGDIASAAQSLVDAVVNIGQSIADKVRQGGKAARSALLETIFGDGDLLAQSAVDDAAGGFTTALRSIASTVAQSGQSILSAAQKPFEERSLSERLLAGESFLSLRTGDEVGVANRGAISQAVKAAQEMGVALLEQGQSAEQVSAALANYRQQIIDFATFTGLATGDVTTLVDTLGLSAASLQRFVSQAAQLNGLVNEIGAQGSQPKSQSPPLTVGPNPIQQFNFDQGAIVIDTNGHGDGQAIALAVVNRVAQGIRR